MTNKVKNTCILLLLITLAGCQHEAETQAEAVKVNKNMVKEKIPTQQGEIWQDVTVIYNDFEGGFYGLVNGSGQKLLPMNLSPEYKIEGTQLRVKGHIIKDMMSIQQWGTAFKITEVELVKLGKNRQLNNTL